MKKKDILTPVGLILGTVMLFWGMKSGGSSLRVFWDPSSIAITVVGSFSALLITYPVSEMLKLSKIIIKTFSENTISSTAIVESFVSMSKKARKNGLLSLEDDMEHIEDEFMKKGMSMVIDGMDPETIKNILEAEIDELEDRHSSGCDMIKAWGAYAPAFGMLGTLIGLIQMLANLTDSSAISSGMGKALITTYYGSIMANLILLPLAGNLSYKSSKEIKSREMMLAGILSVQAGENPGVVEDKLKIFLPPKTRKAYETLLNQGDGVSDNV